MYVKKLVTATLLFAVTAAGAQEFPVRSVRMIVPFAPGGPNDVLGRILAQKLSEQMGQQFIIDNRSGAGGSTGTAAAATSAPDGYTLLFSGTSSLAINPSLYKKLPYNAIKDFAPVSLAGTAPSLLATHMSVPAKSVKELISIAKKSPGKLNYGSGGIGGTPHLAGELLKSLAHIDIVHVPFRGAGPALVALVSGQVDIYIGGIASVLPMVREQRIRPLAVTSAKRTPLMPEMPTFIESGVLGYEVVNWYGIVAPAATPRPVVVKLNSEIVKALATADVAKRFADLGTDAVSSTPEQLGNYHREDLTRWEKVIKAAGIQPE